MGMCKGCGEVFPAVDMNEGFCQTCDNEEIRNKVETEGAKNTTTISLKKEDSIKNVSVGFSWFFLIFGIFYPLVKVDIKYTLIVLVSLIASAMIFPPLSIVLYIGFAFIYNKLYVKDLLKKGYLPLNKYAEDRLKEKNYI